MTLLFVDDEVQLRNYLRTLVDWEGLGYRFAEAENGAAALEIMRREPVHLLMLDITMPVLTGLEVMEWVNENNYNCIAAIMTSHEEIGYAQKAVRLGCFDYILKGDIDGESILALVGRMQSKLSQEIQKKQRQNAAEIAAQRQKTAEARNTINFWFKNSENSALDVARLFEKHLGFPDVTSRYVMLQIMIYDYPEVVSRYACSDIAQFRVVFDNVMGELLEGHSTFYTEYDAGIFLTFIRFDRHCATHVILERVHRLNQRIEEAFTNLLRIRLGIVFTLPFISIATAAERYERLSKLVSYAFWNSPETILCLDDFSLDEREHAAELAAFRKEFTQELYSRSLHHIGLKYDEMRTKIIERRYCIKPESFKSACAACVAAFVESGASDVIVDVQAFSAAKDCEAFKEALLELVSPFCISEENQDKKLLVKKVLLLIQQNFHEDIGLEWLSTRLGVNTSYLSRVFSAELNQPLTAYIQTFRIEQAKLLIRSTNMKLYEIAEKTGFLSQIVFSSTFKKVTGETPSDFKKRWG